MTPPPLPRPHPPPPHPHRQRHGVRPLPNLTSRPAPRPVAPATQSLSLSKGPAGLRRHRGIAGVALPPPAAPLSIVPSPHPPHPSHPPHRPILPLPFSIAPLLPSLSPYHQTPYVPRNFPRLVLDISITLCYNAFIGSWALSRPHRPFRPPCPPSSHPSSSILSIASTIRPVPIPSLPSFSAPPRLRVPPPWPFSRLSRSS